jgi:hypothetical protein
MQPGVTAIDLRVHLFGSLHNLRIDAIGDRGETDDVVLAVHGAPLRGSSLYLK